MRTAGISTAIIFSLLILSFGGRNARAAWNVDTQPPTASCSPASQSTTNTFFTISWSGSDNVGFPSSPLFDVQYNINRGVWLTWLDDTSSTTATFSPAAFDNTYYFRVQVITGDSGGNRMQGWSPSCTVAVSAPAVNDTPVNYSIAHPQWSGSQYYGGRDNPAIFRTVYQDADGAADPSWGINQAWFFINTSDRGDLSSSFYGYVLSPYRPGGGGVGWVYVWNDNRERWYFTQLLPQATPGEFRIGTSLTSGYRQYGTTLLSSNTKFTFSGNFLTADWEISFQQGYLTRDRNRLSELRMYVSDSGGLIDGWDSMDFHRTDLWPPALSQFNAAPLEVEAGEPVFLESLAGDTGSGLDKVKMWIFEASSYRYTMADPAYWQNPFTTFNGPKIAYDPNIYSFGTWWDTTGWAPGYYYVLATAEDMLGNNMLPYWDAVYGVGQRWRLIDYNGVPYQTVRIKRPEGTLSGRLWEDANGDCEINPGESNYTGSVRLDLVGDRYTWGNFLVSGGNIGPGNLPTAGSPYQFDISNLAADYDLTCWNYKVGSEPEVMGLSYSGSSAGPFPIEYKQTTVVNLGVKPRPGNITGYVFMDLDRNGSQDPGEERYNLPTAASVTIWPIGTSQTISSGNPNFNFLNLNAGSYSVELVSSSGYDITTSNNPQSVSLVPGETETVIFGIAPPAVDWFQTEGGDIHAQTNLTSWIGYQASFPYVSQDNQDGYPGVVSAGGQIDVGPSGQVSSTNWQLENHGYDQYVAGGEWEYDYGYFLERAKVIDKTILNSSGPNQNDLRNLESGAYLVVSPDGNLILPDWEVGGGGGEKQITIFVPGNLRIDGRIRLAADSNQNNFIAFIVQGNIEVDPGVYDNSGNPVLEGLYLANSFFSTGSSDKQFVAQGIFIAYGGFRLERDLGEEKNDDTPAERFIYDSNLIWKIPPYLLSDDFVWQEIAP